MASTSPKMSSYIIHKQNMKVYYVKSNFLSQSIYELQVFIILLTRR